MTESVTNADDRQPGGSGAKHKRTLANDDLTEADWQAARTGGSGAGSTVHLSSVHCECYQQREELHAALEAAQTDVAAWRDIATHLRAHFEIADQQRRDLTAEAQVLYDDLQEARNDLAQSRATEAELRAKVERVKAMHTREQCAYPPDEWYCIECHRAFPCPTLAALDAAEQPARAEAK